MIRRHLNAAGIEQINREGKIDFHALRNTYVTLVSESGATWKESVDLARHQSPEMTDHYARARDDRLRGVVDGVGRAVLRRADPDALGTPVGPERVARVLHRGVGDPQEKSATPCDSEDCASSSVARPTGLEPGNRRKSLQDSDGRSLDTRGHEGLYVVVRHRLDPSSTEGASSDRGHLEDTLGPPSVARVLHGEGAPAEVLEMIQRWDDLADEVRMILIGVARVVDRSIHESDA